MRVSSEMTTWVTSSVARWIRSLSLWPSCSHVREKPPGSSSKAIRRRITSVRLSGSSSPLTVTHSPKRSSNWGRSSPSSGFMVPTRVNRAGWVTLTPSRSTVLTPMAAESSSRSTTWSSRRLTSST